MAKIDLTQNDVDNYLATTDEFWEKFQKSLKAPFSLWDEWKDQSIEEWAQTVKNTPGIVTHINLFLEVTPILKGEFICCYHTGFVLTNFRLLINDDPQHIFWCGVVLL